MNSQTDNKVKGQISDAVKRSLKEGEGQKS